MEVALALAWVVNKVDMFHETYSEVSLVIVDAMD